jgi:hypothetical protein
MVAVGISLLRFDADRRAVTASATTRSQVRTLRLAQPAVRTSSRREVTAVAVLVVLAMVLWLVVLPLEFVFAA